MREALSTESRARFFVVGIVEWCMVSHQKLTWMMLMAGRLILLELSFSLFFQHGVVNCVSVLLQLPFQPEPNLRVALAVQQVVIGIVYRIKPCTGFTSI